MVPRHGTQFAIARAHNKQTLHNPFKKCNNYSGIKCIYNLLPKYLRDVKSVKTFFLKFDRQKFIDLIRDEPKMRQEETAFLISYLIMGLRNLQRQSSLLLGREVGFTASKPL